MLALTLEFDASSVKSRVRTGLIQVDSVYHLLVPCPLIRELGNLPFNCQVLLLESLLIDLSSV